MSNSEAVKRYQATKDRVVIQPDKGVKAVWQANAARHGMSLQAFIIDTVNARIVSELNQAENENV